MKILFVCTGNTCRSPMATALCMKGLQEKSDMGQVEGLQFSSAGLFASDNMTASAEAMAVMLEEGIDISDHRSSRLRGEVIRDADLILTMTISQRDYIRDNYPDKAQGIYTLSEFTGDDAGDVLDPYGKNINAYRKSLAQLKSLVGTLINRLIESK